MSIQISGPRSDSPHPHALAEFSETLATQVEHTGARVVAVPAGRHDTVGGVLWQTDVVVTVAHALRRTQGLSVLMPDGGRRATTFVGADAATDLAVLRIDAAQLADASVDELAAPPAPTAPIRTGNYVVAVTRGAHGEIAASGGLVGRASGAWQTWRGGQLDRLIRLDGGLYPGFSGAAVIDARGVLIGIASAALARGFGVVIPHPTIERIAAQLLADGRVARGYLGIGTQPVELPAAQVGPLQLDGPGALLVSSLAPDGPAARAGWMIGDALISIAGKRTTDLGDLQAALAAVRVNASVDAVVVRGGARLEATVIVGERPRMACH